jgi:hypothetical protein
MYTSKLETISVFRTSSYRTRAPHHSAGASGACQLMAGACYTIPNNNTSVSKYDEDSIPGERSIPLVGLLRLAPRRTAATRAFTKTPRSSRTTSTTSRPAEYVLPSDRPQGLVQRIPGVHRLLDLLLPPLDELGDALLLLLACLAALAHVGRAVLHLRCEVRDVASPACRNISQNAKTT